MGSAAVQNNHAHANTDKRVCGDHIIFSASHTKFDTFLHTNKLSSTQELKLSTAEYNHKYKIELHKYSYNNKSSNSHPIISSLLFKLKDGRKEITDSSSYAYMFKTITMSSTYDGSYWLLSSKSNDFESVIDLHLLNITKQIHITWRITIYSSLRPGKRFLFSPSAEYLLIFAGGCSILTLPHINYKNINNNSNLKAYLDSTKYSWNIINCMNICNAHFVDSHTLLYSDCSRETNKWPQSNLYLLDLNNHKNYLNFATEKYFGTTALYYCSGHGTIIFGSSIWNVYSPKMNNITSDEFENQDFQYKIWFYKLNYKPFKLVLYGCNTYVHVLEAQNFEKVNHNKEQYKIFPIDGSQNRYLFVANDGCNWVIFDVPSGELRWKLNSTRISTSFEWMFTDFGIINSMKYNKHCLMSHDVPLWDIQQTKKILMEYVNYVESLVYIIMAFLPQTLDDSDYKIPFFEKLNGGGFPKDRVYVFFDGYSHFVAVFDLCHKYKSVSQKFSYDCVLVKIPWDFILQHKCANDWRKFINEEIGID
eukprot:456921_1